MATKNKTLDELQEEFLECDICKELFDNEERQPRLLPCLHTFCTSCLEKMIENEWVNCPNCMERYQAPGNKVDVFKKDNNRRELLDFVMVRNKEPDLVCNYCGEDKAVSRCQECAEFLCEVCDKMHGKRKNNRDHAVASLGSLKQSNLASFTQSRFCSIAGHENNKLTLYCEDCEKVVCIHCTATAHAHTDHNIRNIEEVCREKKETVLRLLKETEELKTSELQESLQKQLHSIDDIKQQLQSQIDAAMNNCIGMIERRREVLKKEAQDRCESKMKILDNQLKITKDHGKHLEDSTDFAGQTMQHQNPANFLELEQTITSRLIQLKNDKPDETPYEDDKISFGTCDFTAFQQHVFAMGSIECTSVYPPKTEVRKIHLGKPGLQTVLEVQLNDYLGVPQPNSPAVKLRVEVCDPEGQRVGCEIKQNGTGLLSVIADIGEPGFYKARVDVLGATVWEGVLGLGSEEVSRPRSGKAYLDSLSMEELRRKYLRCPICSKDYGQGHLAVVLPCLHTVGRQCAEKSPETTCPWPICHAELSHKQLKDSPADSLTDLVKEYAKIRQADEVKIDCGYTSRCGRKSVSRCKDCPTYLCKKCTDDHERCVVALGNHEILSLKALREADELKDLIQPKMCPIEGHEKLSLYCTHCDTLVCTHCAISGRFRSGVHEVESAIDVYDTKKEAFAKDLQALKFREDEVENTVQAVEREIRETDQRLAEVCRQIDRAFEEGKQSLDERSQRLKTKGRELTSEAKGKLLEQLEQLKSQQCSLLETDSLSSDQLRFNDKMAFLQVYRIMTDRVCTQTKLPVDEYPCQATSLRFLNANINDLIGSALENVENISSSDVVPWSTEVKLSPRVEIEKESVVLTLHLLNNERRVPDRYEEGSVAVCFRDSFCEALDVKIAPRQDEKGILDVLIRPVSPVEHKFLVKVLGKPIATGSVYCIAANQDIVAEGHVERLPPCPDAWSWDTADAVQAIASATDTGSPPSTEGKLTDTGSPPGTEGKRCSLDSGGADSAEPCLAVIEAFGKVIRLRNEDGKTALCCGHHRLVLGECDAAKETVLCADEDGVYLLHGNDLYEVLADEDTLQLAPFEEAVVIQGEARTA